MQIPSEKGGKMSEPQIIVDGELRPASVLDSASKTGKGFFYLLNWGCRSSGFSPAGGPVMSSAWVCKVYDNLDFERVKFFSANWCEQKARDVYFEEEDSE